jgi:eukaryotic-like serine/threonine-protein kinase
MTEDTTKHDRWEWISGILVDALQISDPNARDAFVRERCGEDAEALREIRSLLVADTKFATTLEGGGIASAARSAFSTPPATIDEVEAASAHVGKRLGAYEIVGIIAVGGMGAVYKAKRVDASYEALVAVKIMRADLSAKTAQTVLARFRAERQMLANLNHPNITKIVDGGSTDEGLPYFVMEYVDGEPIDRFCESRGLPVAERLQKFRDVLSAVHYAHQRLIVHRDLKPNNILVDKNGVVKLLDFGIARLLDPESSGAATSDGGNATTMLAMTPAYASPEQVKSEAITTASDVYSLGVVLYRLLTGVSPYKSKNTQPLELAREIAETDPERPSTAITAATRIDPLANDAETKRERTVRNIDVARLKKTLRGDLDNIVLMALRKDPARRYASAEQFGEDIRRYLAHEPVIAHADSLAYRANKFVRRNRWSVAFASLAALGLIGGITATTYQAKVARDAQARAEAERVRAETHFKSVRSLANEDLFAIHNALSKIPGTVSVRKDVLERATRYLQTLSQDSSNNPLVLAEAGRGWLRLGKSLGDYQGEAVGDSEKSKEAYERGIALLQRSYDLDKSEFARSELIEGYASLGSYYAERTKLAEGDAALRKGIAIAVSEQESNVSNGDLLAASAVVHLIHAQHVRGNTQADFDRRVAYLKRAQALLERLLVQPPTAELRDLAERRLSIVYQLFSELAGIRPDGKKDSAEILFWANKAHNLARAALQRDPNNPRLQRRLADTYEELGFVTATVDNNIAGSVEMLRKGEAILRNIAEKDKDDRAAVSKLLWGKVALATMESQLPTILEADATIADAEQLLQTMNSKERQITQVIAAEVGIHATRARTYARRASELTKSEATKAELCQKSLQSYRNTQKVAATISEYSYDTMADEYRQIRDVMKPCARYVAQFPDK